MMQKSTSIWRAMAKQDNTLLWTLGITVAVVVLYYWLFYNTDTLGIAGDVTQMINDAINGIVRGARLTDAPYDKTTGLVPETPDDLAGSCGLDVETYCLARAISSEEGLSTNGTKLAVGWAIYNYSRKYGSVRTAVTTRDDSFGIQWLVGYCSTAQDPYEGDASIAAMILTGQVADPTGGATQFDRPAGENAAQVQANRLAAGKTLIPGDSIGASSGLEFWR